MANSISDWVEDWKCVIAPKKTELCVFGRSMCSGHGRGFWEILLFLVHVYLIHVCDLALDTH